MRFKDYFTESLGLGNLGAKLHSFYTSPWLDQRLQGAYITNGNNGIEQPEDDTSAKPNYLAATELTVPQVTRTGIIEVLNRHTNPIYLRLSDGTEIEMTHDQFLKVKGQPSVGKVMTVIFQRHSSDMTEQRSKIDQCFVHGAI